MDIKLLQELPPWDWPEEAAGALHEVLADSRASADDRENAAGFAGDLVVMNDQLAADLLTILTNADEPEPLRAIAAISFGAVLEEREIDEFMDPAEDSITEETFFRILETLQKLYRDSSVPKLVRRRILEAAVRGPEGWQEEAIREAYASGDSEWVLTAVFAMRFTSNFERQVLESLNSGDEDTHCEALRAAGSKELEEVWPHISALLSAKKTPKELLIAAIEAAGQIRGQKAFGTLERFTESKDEDIADAAKEALMMAAPNEYDFYEDGDDAPF
jgi:HEAT repeat protein